MNTTQEQEQEIVEATRRLLVASVNGPDAKIQSEMEVLFDRAVERFPDNFELISYLAMKALVISVNASSSTEEMQRSVDRIRNLKVTSIFTTINALFIFSTWSQCEGLAEQSRDAIAEIRDLLEASHEMPLQDRNDILSTLSKHELRLNSSLTSS